MKLGRHGLVVYNPVDPDADRLWDADAERFGSAGIDRKLIRSGLPIGMSPALVPRMIFATISAALRHSCGKLKP